MARRPELYSVWRPAPAARGAVLVIHGFGEHVGRYDHVFAALNARGYSCLGVDQRGFGRSGGRRAYVRAFDDYLDDVAWGLDALQARAPGPPVLLGHSQGGLVAALYAMERRPALRGLVLSSPALRFLVRVPWWKRALAQLTSAFWPTLSLPADLDAKDLTHDPDARQRMREDELAVRVATARWWTESLRAQRRARDGAEQIQAPTLLQVAGADRVVDAAATRAFFERLGAARKEWISYPDLFHEVYQEVAVDRARALDDLCRWLDQLTQE
ncbi:MAG: lysophospholipase [Planctomycetota bacterium]|nr:lysophospholipase [Planctomycetota bacterium]